MSDTAEKKSRKTWTHHDVAQLMRAFAENGATGARAALEGDFSLDQIDQKLAALGLVQLTTRDKQEIQTFVASLTMHEHPNLVIDHALVELRKARKP